MALLQWHKINTTVLLFKTLGKHEATAIELINISEQVNKGVNLITFFRTLRPQCYRH